MLDIEKKKKELCEEIGNFFGDYKEEDGVIFVDNGEKIFKYSTYDDMLLDWVDTLVENHRDMQDSGNLGDSWENEILFIYSIAPKKHPIGVRKVENKSGTVWSAYADIYHPDFPHGKNVHLGCYKSIVDAIGARIDYQNIDLENVDTRSKEGFAIAMERANARCAKAKQISKGKKDVVYTVSVTSERDYDFSSIQTKHGAFTSYDAAIKRMKDIVVEFKKNHKDVLERYSDSEKYPDEGSGALIITEEYSAGYWGCEFGFDEHHEMHHICVDEWELK